MGAYLPIMQVNMIVRPDSAPPRLYDLIDHDNMYWFIYTARHARHDHHVLNVAHPPPSSRRPGAPMSPGPVWPSPRPLHGLA